MNEGQSILILSLLFCREFNDFLKCLFGQFLGNWWVGDQCNGALAAVEWICDKKESASKKIEHH